MDVMRAVPYPLPPVGRPYGRSRRGCPPSVAAARTVEGAAREWRAPVGDHRLPAPRPASSHRPSPFAAARSTEPSGRPACDH
jgi:hypothetical protein